MADIVKYEVDGQEIQLDPMTVRKYLVNGNNVSDSEVKLFIELCKAQKLNPFTRDAYLVKYGTSPAQIVTGKDAFTKRAESNPDYAGKQAGIIVINLKKDVEYREGTFYLKGREELVGGWAKVFFKSNKGTERSTVSLDEYTTNKNLWATKPATMIRKVAVVQALREAFPSALSQLYIEEEMGIDEELPKDHINPEEERFNEFHVDEPENMASKIEKQQVMQLAAEKGLMNGTGKNADISKLVEFAQNYHINIKSMTSVNAKNLIQLLIDYESEKAEEVVDVPEEEIKEEPIAEKLDKNTTILRETSETIDPKEETVVDAFGTSEEEGGDPF
ncbi:MAG: phage recombination protein Bet [Bacilli bacterium]